MKVSVQISWDGNLSKNVQLNSYGELKAWLANLGPNALSITKITWQILDLEKKPVKSMIFEQQGHNEYSTASTLPKTAELLTASETPSWFDHWITSFLIRLFPKGRFREEMLGDLTEEREAMLQEANRPQWFIDLQMLGKVIVYAANGISIHLSNIRNNSFSQKP